MSFFFVLVLYQGISIFLVPLSYRRSQPTAVDVCVCVFLCVLTFGVFHSVPYIVKSWIFPVEIDRNSSVSGGFACGFGEEIELLLVVSNTPASARVNLLSCVPGPLEVLR